MFDGGWFTFAAIAFRHLRPDSLLHLDVMGIAHREAIRAKYRFWRFKTWIFESMLNAAVGHSNIITTINQTHADYLLDVYHKSAEVISDKLDETWFDQLVTLPPAADREVTNVLFVGSIARGRLDRFMSAYGQVARERSDIRLAVVGDGADLARYRRDFADLKISFPGYESHDQLLPRFLNANICYSDVWSAFGSPFKLYEYMASGRAILTHDTQSVREILENGQSCLLCGETAESIGVGLARLIDNPVLRQRLGSNARQRALELREAALKHGFARVYHDYLETNRMQT